MTKRKPSPQKNEVKRTEVKRTERGIEYNVVIKGGGEFWTLPAKYGSGILHRELGPAVTWADGSEFWYNNGKYHSEFGPAIINHYWSNKRHEEYFLHGKKISKEEWTKQIAIKKFELV